MMSIGEFSQRCGLSQKRLRAYADAGLLPPAAVDSETGYRYYSPGQQRDARIIDALRGAGVPLADIATVLSDPTAFDFDEWQLRLEGAAASELAAVCRAANAAIFDRAAAEPHLTGMGTTLCAAALVADGSVAVVNIGDSRAYLLRDRELRQLTCDHTMTADLVRRGDLDEVDSDRHPYRHVLTRVLGVLPTVEVDTFTVDPVDGDVIMLCTDGLSKALSNRQIAGVMLGARTPADTAGRLVDRALASSATDNVTVVVMHISRAT